MLGSASATTVESSIRMKRPAQAPTSVHQRRFRSSIGNTLRQGRRRDRGRARFPSGNRPRPDRGRGPSGRAAPRPRARGSRPSAPCTRCCRRSPGSRRRRPTERRCSGSAASSARFSSIGSAAGPASWIRVGTTHSTAGWARFHWQASWIGFSSSRSAIGHHPLELLQAGLDPAGGTERAVIALGQLHPRPRCRPRTGRRSRRPG